MMIGLVMLLIVAFCYIITAYAFCDAALQPSKDFQKIGQNKYLWLFMIFVIGIFAAAPYMLYIRPKIMAIK